MMLPAGKILGAMLLCGFVICLLAVESVEGQRGGPRGGPRAGGRGGGRFHGKHPGKTGNFSKKFREIFGEDREDVPSFCHKRACPKFTVLEKTEEYELRQYEASNWLAVQRSSDRKNNRRMFRVMFDYIRGNNSENRTVEMGVPVLKKLVPGGDKQDMSMLFYMSQPNLPEPNDSRLYFVALPAQKVYVRVFGGYAYRKLNEDNRQKLVDAVGEEKVVTESYFAAGYDAPWVKKDRHNEIWLLSKDN